MRLAHGPASGTVNRHREEGSGIRSVALGVAGKGGVGWHGGHCAYRIKQGRYLGVKAEKPGALKCQGQAFRLLAVALTESRGRRLLRSRGCGRRAGGRRRGDNPGRTRRGCQITRATVTSRLRASSAPGPRPPGRIDIPSWSRAVSGAPSVPSRANARRSSCAPALARDGREQGADLLVPRLGRQIRSS
jgi:hypothetical protein